MAVSSETCAFDLIAAETIRDVRAGEILAIEPGGRVKLTDFGVARMQDSGDTT